MLRKVSALLAALILSGSCTDKKKTAPVTGALAAQGMVVSEHPLASQAGGAILRKGGNAFDAAIAVQFALTAVLPRAGNLTGGGFMVYRQSDGQTGFLDYRETAPPQASANMYLDKAGQLIPNLSIEGALASGIPGTVAGMVEMHKRFGSLPLADLIEPAIALARNGHAITQDLTSRLNFYRADFIRVNGLQEGQFDGYPFIKDTLWQKGDTLSWPRLAETLERIKAAPYEEFYMGHTGKQIVEGINRRGGIFSMEAMQRYRPVWRDPVVGQYKGYKIISAAPPSSGGVTLLQILSMASQYNLKAKGHNTPSYIHLLAEIENRAFADRSKYLGDPDFVAIPTQALLQPDYLNARAASIDTTRKTAAANITPGPIALPESMETTHFSIVDAAGNAVAVTTTLNSNFGSKLFLPELGLFMNNEMDDFSAKPGEPNQFGLIGGKYNAIAPNKRMLSSMTPTIVEQDGKLKMLIGSPGGSTIITSTLQVLLNVVEFDMTMQEAVNAARFHSQWYPDEIMVEKQLVEGDAGKNIRERLASMGHDRLKEEEFIGKVQAILIRPDGSIEGAPDVTRSESGADGVE